MKFKKSNTPLYVGAAVALIIIFGSWYLLEKYSLLDSEGNDLNRFRGRIEKVLKESGVLGK